MHESVLVDDVLGLLQPCSGGVYVDGTIGGGGHALAILRAAGQKAFLLGIDRDTEALERSRKRLSSVVEQVRLVHGAYADVSDIVRSCGIEKVDGIVLDVGVSSDQLDTPQRGFSFQAEGPLDMRMNTSGGQTAADLVNSLSGADLYRLIRNFGEERSARRIAKAIVDTRVQSPIMTTTRLAELVSGVVGGRKGRLHPATKTFQALRIAVNDELGQLARGVEGALSVLKDGGRLVVISFHRLEDRIVKQFAREHQGKWMALAQGGEEWRGTMPPVKTLTKKPIAPGECEVARNARSRSARLRAVERQAQPVDRKGRRKGEV